MDNRKYPFFTPTALVSTPNAPVVVRPAVHVAQLPAGPVKPPIQYFHVNPIMAPTKKEVTLKPHQQKHYKRLCDILTSFYCAIDTSETGSGKSYTASKYFKDGGFKHMLVICAGKAGITNWQPIKDEYGLNMTIINYESLRSIRGKQPKHGLLSRVDTRTEKGSDLVDFYPTHTLLRMLDEGTLLVVDECQHVKNPTAQGKAVRALTSAIISRGGKSRFIFMSATPFDKIEHSVNFLKNIGFIRSTNLYYTDQLTGEIIPTGLEECASLCRSIDKAGSREVELLYPCVTKRNVKEICLEYCKQVISKSVSSSMVLPPSEFGEDVKNGYYSMDKKDASLLIESIDDLASAVKYSAHTGEIDMRNVPMGKVVKARMKTEQSKRNVFIRKAVETLRGDSFCKVLIYLDFLESVTYIASGLRDFMPMILTGATSLKDRAQFMKNFELSDAHRLIIAITKVGGESISLHDVVGGRKRYMFISPNYSIIDQKQASGRITRDGMLSNSCTRYMYGKVGKLETSILDAWARKAVIIRATIHEEWQNKIRLPGEYDTEEEP